VKKRSKRQTKKKPHSGKPGFAKRKNVPPLACYDFGAHEWILIFFGRNVTDKIGNQMLLHYLAKRGNTKITYFTQLDSVTHTMHLCAIFLKEKIVICDVFDSV